MMPLFSVFPTVGLNFVSDCFRHCRAGRYGQHGRRIARRHLHRRGAIISGYYVAPAYGQMFFFILFLLVMIFRPNGLLGQKGAAMLGVNE